MRIFPGEIRNLVVFRKFIDRKKLSLTKADKNEIDNFALFQLFTLSLEYWKEQATGPQERVRYILININVFVDHLAVFDRR